MRRSRKAKEKEGGGKWRGRQSRVKEKESHPHHHQEETSSVDGGARFFGCYLLTSLSPRYKGHSYIGFTVNPKRRIRQHNGVVTSGANTTKKKRPWDMVLCIHGFPTNVAALQFEWAWQHPKDSIAVRETAASFKTLGGLANKIKLALTMLTLPSWHCMDLTVTFFSTLYMKHAAGCPPLPPQMNLHFSSMDELPCYFNPHHPSSSSHLDHHPNLLHSPSTSPHLTNPDSPLAQTYNSPQHISNQPIVCRLLDKDLSDMIPNASPDKLLPPLGTYTDEHPRPSPFDTCIYSNKVFPSLKKHMDLAHVHPSNLGDFTTPTKECCPQTSFPRLKEKIEPFRQPDTYVRDQPLTVDSVSTKKRAAQNDSFTCIFINESPEEKCQPTGNCLPKTSAEMEGIEPVEVIDLFTPSPDCRIVAVTKKRRTCSDRSDLIDLTRSPLFLDL